MNRVVAGCVLFAGVGMGWAQSPSPAAAPECSPGVPVKEHSWLKQLEGDWTIEYDLVMGPGKPPVKSAGSETARMLGPFWLLTDVENKMGEQVMKARMTLGFDARSKTYTGSFISDMDGHMWVYSGEVDAAGKVLTLNTTGPSTLDPVKPAPYKETIEITDLDHRTFTSQIQMPDGTWSRFMTAKYTRKK